MEWFIFHRPGFSRLNLPYFMTDEEADFVIKAVAMVAQNGWKLLPQVCNKCNLNMLHSYFMLLEEVINSASLNMIQFGYV